MHLTYLRKREFLTKMYPHHSGIISCQKGGSEKPLELYKKFRGREPKPEAMLKRSGLLITP